MGIESGHRFAAEVAAAVLSALDDFYGIVRQDLLPPVGASAADDEEAAVLNLGADAEVDPV